MNTALSKSEEFFEAVKSNDINKVDELLSSAIVDVNLKNPKEKGRTALHIASHEDYYELVCMLVDKYHADVNATDEEGELPLQLATDRYYMKIVKFLLKRNSNLQEYAARYLNSEPVEELITAAESNDINKVAQLVTSGVDVNSEDRSNYNQTVLEVAADKGFYELAVALVDEHGADLHHEDETGESAYHKAANNKHDNIANFLAERGYVYKNNYDRSSSESDVSLSFLPN
ncbi:uncharacterized protein LOC126379352 isoform X2 [Pectinophora gossypiella]|uniref:uncharacterized protein LOC126379352 isoform X2 n=1 Tax=Pectinophora gossypiella TaxID=13191 RepID=UPI00214E0F01|nr:uncharacterized protein LOC126379352 isoform X2 [Pectinophora gossypiella]